MPRVRKPVTPTLKGNVFLARVEHPVTRKTICWSFGDATEVKTNVDAFNRIFLNRDLWQNPPPPPETPDKIYQQWMGHGNTVTIAGNSLMRGKKALPTGSDEIARLTTEVDALKTQLQSALDKIGKQERELETWRGKKISKVPSPTLEQARQRFMKAYRTGALSKKAGKIPDTDAIKNIEWDLERFCKHFGETTPADFIEGAEGTFSDWLHSLKNAKGETLSASRRMQLRVYVLMMLEYAGAKPNRKTVIRPDTSETRVLNDTTKDINSIINYLTQQEARKIIEELPATWAEMFRVQCALGLRPDELLTLHKNNFTPDLSKLTLAPLLFTDRYGEKVTLTLKTGPRDIPIPGEIRPLLKARLKSNAVVFPGPDETAWNNPKEYNRQYKAALVKAAKLAKVKKPIDSRSGRRSCASWLMQADVSAEKIAKLLGNSPQMIREHYGDPDVMGMNLTRTVL